ncbi:MAG: glycosyltransferase, partial [Phycisphaerales bacterium]|nr:glycosyltransferase [Phycisphaerales bacterium]
MVLFVALMILPGIFGAHMYVLIWLSRRRDGLLARQRETIASFQVTATDTDWPVVTTQLPIYNEVAVVERLIDAVAAIDYPRDRHEIQILDDSNDATRDVIDRAAWRWRDRGVDIKVVRRSNRTHYKAGALAHGVTTARGEFIAIFDADFLPGPDFLRNLIPLALVDAKVACVQGRWGHLNRDETWITRAVALGMDGHFAIEQPARAWNGMLLNFNGTAGLWRRSAIDAPGVGGWSGDTVTEDLDLSYRAQLAGWKIVFHLDAEAPAEIPADVNALKAQQRRWATGSIQTARKLLGRVWRSPLPLSTKAEATLHLLGYSVNLWMLLMAVIGQPLLWIGDPDLMTAWFGVTSAIVVFAAIGPSLAYMLARRRLTGKWPRASTLIGLITVGFGLSVNNGLAVINGWFTRGGEFVRTPKSGSAGAARGVSRYRAVRSRVWAIEIVLGVWCVAQWVIA